MLKWRFYPDEACCFVAKDMPPKNPEVWCIGLLVDEFHIWIKRSNNSPSKKNNSQQGAVVYHHAVLLSQNLWTKRSSERNLSAWQKSIDWGLAKFEGVFFFESAVWFKHSLIIWNFKFYWEAHISFRDIWKTISVTVTSLPWLFGCLGFPGFSHCQVVSVQQDKSEGS